MNSNEKKVSRKIAPNKSAKMVETIYGCKWSLTIYQLLKDGINRPGEMVRCVDGLTTKVLNQCLKRNVEFGILEKEVFNELPPRVEYRVTELGRQFLAILAQLDTLQKHIDSQSD